MAISHAAAAAMIKDSLRACVSRRLSFPFLRELEEKNSVPYSAAHGWNNEADTVKCSCPEWTEKGISAIDILRWLLACDGVGIPLMIIPPSLGGIACGLPGITAAGFELGRTDSGIATGVLATLLAVIPVFTGGTPFQKKRLAERMKDGGKKGTGAGLVGAFAATEPHGGSSLAEIHTRAERVVENGRVAAYRITGTKQWITNAGIADFYLVLASAPEGPSWFLVNKGAKGLSFGKSERKYGQNLSVTGSVFLDGVSVPAENLVGLNEGSGLRQAAAAFDITRFALAAMGAGAGSAALEEAVQYALSRKDGTSVLAENSAYINSLVVPHFARMEAVRAYLAAVSAFGFSSSEDILSGCAGKPAGVDFSGLATEAAIAKFFSAEACVKACEAAVQACGGMGFSREFPVGKRLADSLVLPVYEGADEVLKIAVCRGRWQNMLKSGGRFYTDRAELLITSCGTDGKTSGCTEAAKTLRILAGIMELCRRHKLTRDKYISLKLGGIIAEAEVSAAFAMAAAGLGHASAAMAMPGFADSVSFDYDTMKCLARIFARETLIETACSGSVLVTGAVSSTDMFSVEDRKLLPDMNRIISASGNGAASDYAFAAGRIVEHIRRRQL